MTNTKERKKKRSFPFFGWLIAGATFLGVIGLSTGGKAGGVTPPLPPPIDVRIRQCVESGGVWNPQFQRCEFPEGPPIPDPLSSPACGLLTASFATGTGFYHVTPFADNLQWSETLALATSRPGARVVWENAFTVQLRNWLQCRLDAGEIQPFGSGGTEGGGTMLPEDPIACPPGTHRNEFGLCVPNVILTRRLP